MGLHVPAPGAQVTLAGAGLRDLAKQSERVPAGRIAAVCVVVLWLLVVLAVLARLIDYAPAAFLAAGVFTFAITLVLAFDAAVDWADPDESESLARRLQPELAWPLLENFTGLIRVGLVPVCFVGGLVLGHFAWH